MGTAKRTFVEQVIIEVNGTVIAPAITNAIRQVEVESSFEMPDTFRITIRDDDAEWVDKGPFEIGTSIKIKLKAKPDNAFKPIMEGEISAIEMEYNEQYNAFLIVRGYDKRYRINRGKQAEAYVNVTDDDIAKKLGVSGVSISADSTSGGIREHVFQDNQTNLAFLTELGRTNGFELMPNGNGFKFVKSKTSKGTVDLTWGVDLNSFYPRVSVAGQINEVEVRGWDPKQKQAVIGKAKSSSVHPQINVGGSGGDVAKKALGDAKFIEVHRPVTSQTHADAIAQSILDEVNATFVEADGETDGNPDILAGTEIKIGNLGKKFSGTYLATWVRHVYGYDGYYTEFAVSGTRPRLMAELVDVDAIFTTKSERWTGIYPAIVTNNEDPDGMGRVKVKYPWFNDSLESGWARVVMEGAGNKRGIQWLPEVNDEVAVGFEHGDMNFPYVLGGLYNGEDAVPQTKSVEGGKVEKRTLMSREGHRLQFVDKNGQQMIEFRDSQKANRLRMDTSGEEFSVKSKGDIHLQSVNPDGFTFGGEVKEALTEFKDAYQSRLTGATAGSFIQNTFGKKPADEASKSIEDSSGGDGDEETTADTKLEKPENENEPPRGTGANTQESTNDFSMYAMGNMMFGVLEEVTFEARHTETVTSAAAIVIVAIAPVTFAAPTVSISAVGAITMKAGGDINIEATTAVSISATTINMNVGAGATIP